MFPATIHDLEEIRRQTLKMARRRALFSAAGSVVPLPFTGVAADVVLLRQIIPKINEKFGLAPEQIDEYAPQMKIMIYDLSKKFGARLIGRLITKELIVKVMARLGVRLSIGGAAKYVPVVGQIVSAGISYGGMRLIINSHINQCYKVAQAVMRGKGIPGALHRGDSK